jgi:tetratricopeptide (TPR) repeat protein
MKTLLCAMRLSCAALFALLFCACGGGSEWRRDWELGERALSHGRLAEAEPALEAALASAEVLRPGEARSGRDDRLVSSLNALGDLRMAQGSPTKAELLYRRALALLEKRSGPDSPETAAAVAYLAEACAMSGKAAEADKLLRRSLSSAEKDPRRHAEIAARLSELAALERALGRDDEAAAAYRRALAVTEKALGPESRLAADRLTDLALFHHARGDFAEAEGYYQRALAVKEKVLGPGNPETEAALNDLALFYEAQEKLDDAEALYKRALAELEKSHGRASPRLAPTLGHYAHLMRRRGRVDRAAALEARARALNSGAAKPRP